MKIFFFLVTICLMVLSSCANGKQKNAKEGSNLEPKVFSRDADYWWPEQKKPQQIIVCKISDYDVQELMLAESLAGIAAKAVTDNRNNELVWFETDNASFKTWFQMLQRRLNVTQISEMDVWKMLEHFSEKNLIEGYVAYRLDHSEGQIYKERESVDQSSNIATTVAGVLNAVIVEKSLEAKVRKIGLDKLYDATGKDYDAVYEQFKSQLNPYMLMLVDTKAHHHRDMAVANNIFVFNATSKAEMSYFMNNIEVSSPLLGWGFGNEALFTGAASEAGLFVTASNWCQNLPLMSAGSRDYQVKKVKSLHPKDIDWEKKGHYHSFIMSDGDNMQWLQKSFFHNTDYWANAHNGEFPMGWTTCAAQLLEMMPDVHDYLSETQPEDATLIEFSGGYHYPDLFGATKNGEQDLRVHARKVNVHMQQSGTKVFGFICMDLDSDASKKAYQIYAEELDDLTGMIAIQYNPYQGGDGKVYWVKNKKGQHIPVVTAKYALWANIKSERSGNPEEISKLVNSEVEKADRNNETAISWTSVHVWSTFEQNGESAKGLTSVKWTIDKFSEKVNVVNPAEMLWRIRMQHYPEEVNAILKE